MIDPATAAVIVANVAVRLAFLALFVLLAFGPGDRRPYRWWAAGATVSLALPLFVVLDKTAGTDGPVWLSLAFMSAAWGVVAIVCGGLRACDDERRLGIVLALPVLPAAIAFSAMLAGGRSAAILAADLTLVTLFLVMGVAIYRRGFLRLGLWSAAVTAGALVGTGLASAGTTVNAALAGADLSQSALLGPIFLTDTIFTLVLYVAHLALPMERSQRNYRARAHLDPLTGLRNRAGFADAAALRVATAGEAGASVYLMVADLDRFKAINDRHGHDVGDAVLCEAATVLAATYPSPDAVVARWGGEEFVVLVAVASGSAAEAAAETARRCIAEASVSADGVPVPITCSIGVAPVQGSGPEALLAAFAAADRALYDAKARGRDRVVLADGPVPDERLRYAAS